APRGAHHRRPPPFPYTTLFRSHVDQVRARPERQRVAVARVLPRVRRDLPRLADPPRREDDRLGLEEHDLPVGSPIADGARDALAVLQQARDRALHVHVDPLVDPVVLEGPDHLETGPVADMREARVAMTAEVALEDAS